MARDSDPLEALPAPARRRLDQFAAAFERLDAGEYVLFAADVDGDADVAAAVARIRDLAPGSRGVPGTPAGAAIRAAAASFGDWAAQAYSRRLPQSDTFLLYQSLPDRAMDRVRFRATLERAVSALILWDSLPEDDRELLLGPWSVTAHRALGG